ncbi:MAG: zinc ABC transporter ATP-binding protein AztA [Devosia sp.]
MSALTELATGTIAPVAGPAAPAIAMHDLTLGYDGHPAVHHLDGTFDVGSLTAVTGPNGSGKSTLLKGIMGQLPPLGGRIEVTPTDIAYLPQSAEIDRTFPMRVSELVGLGLWRKLGSSGAFGKAEQLHVAEALAAVGLSGFARRGLDTLSGGQLQRALFARMLVQDAPLLLLDEPFTGIDMQTVEDLMSLVGRWRAEGRTVIAVLHDLTLVRQHFPQTLLMAREPIAWGPTSSVLSVDNLGKARAMPEAWDDHAPWHANGRHNHNGKAA